MNECDNASHAVNYEDRHDEEVQHPLAILCIWAHYPEDKNRHSGFASRIEEDDRRLHDPRPFHGLECLLWCEVVYMAITTDKCQLSD